jgi:hypothetical protein
MFLVNPAFVTLASWAVTPDVPPADPPTAHTHTIDQAPSRFEWVVDIRTRRIVRRPIREESGIAATVATAAD